MSCTLFSYFPWSAEIMNTSSILIVPSIWDDPFPLTALEGLASGQAVIASARGGLIEMLKDIGILINDINSKKLVQEMKKLMIDHKKLNDFQKKSWNYECFGPRK